MKLPPLELSRFKTSSKKSAGHPKKSPVAVVVKKETVAKKSAGRPKKSPVAVVVKKSPVAKKGAGRPKKTVITIPKGGKKVTAPAFTGKQETEDKKD